MDETGMAIIGLRLKKDVKFVGSESFAINRYRVNSNLSVFAIDDSVIGEAHLDIRGTIVAGLKKVTFKLPRVRISTNVFNCLD